MKIPLKPPDYSVLTREVLEDYSHEQLAMIMGLNTSYGPITAKGEYVHWDRLRHLTPPGGLDHPTWWFALKSARNSISTKLPLNGKHGRPFVFVTPEPVLRMLHELDRDACGEIRVDNQVMTPETRDTYLVRSLIEEAITSSQLEGAATTRKVAKEMLMKGRKPRTHGEHMIANNYRAMQFIREIRNDDLTPALILELHRIVTENTLENPQAAGRLRTDLDDIHVVDATDSTVRHIPPDACELEIRIQKVCTFANGQGDGPFIHPAIRAILLHFALAYDHPFVDGNGRTARALFYWSMAREGYWLMEYTTISRILKEAPIQYARAFLYTETDDNDTTYFIIQQLNVIRKAIGALHEYITHKSETIHATEQLLRKVPELQARINHRQLALLNHALKHPGNHYRIQGHRRSHNVTYDTARTDLLKLADIGWLDKHKSGKAYVFIAPADMYDRIKETGAKQKSS